MDRWEGAIDLGIYPSFGGGLVMYEMESREGRFWDRVGRVSYSYLHMYHATLHHAALMNRNAECRVISGAEWDLLSASVPGSPERTAIPAPTSLLDSTA